MWKFLFFIPSLLWAASFEVIGPCHQKPLFRKEVKVYKGQSVAVLTLAVLKNSGVPFEGNIKGIKQIYDSAVGDDALEVLSDVELRAHGWCYSIDGHVPEVFPYQYKFIGTEKSIKWFYGYSHLIKDKWGENCQPTYKVRPKKYCP